MEIIIGREEGARRLHCTADGREFNVGQAGCVPASVSRKHCKLIINGEKITIENLKEQNITYVDGNQIFSKVISANSKVQLGMEKYTIPLQEIIQMSTGRTPASNNQQQQVPTFSLKPLEPVWNEYDHRKTEIQDKANKAANMAKLQGVLSMLGMCIGFIPGVDQTIRITIIVAALLIAIYFFIQSSAKDSTQKQLRELDEEYIIKYKCPNPTCGKPFGLIRYRQIEYTKQCLACGCKYTH